ncbi:hypothetical protein Tiera_015 [Polaromonas phage Tiera]|nr:hypothetical protein Tiera_015 [Polaromonas phage Tiera]
MKRNPKKQGGFLLNPWRFGGGGPPPGPTGDPLWDQVILLVEASNGFVDRSQMERPLTYAAGATISSVASPVSPNSFELPNARLLVPGGSQAFAFGAEDFTVEMFANLNTGGANGAFFATRANNATVGDRWSCNANGANQALVYADGYKMTSATALAINDYGHLAFVRKGGLGMLFWKGVLIASGWVDNFFSFAESFSVGGLGNNDENLNIRADSIRVTRAARYKANFAPPESLFDHVGPYSDKNLLIAHMTGSVGNQALEDKSHYRRTVGCMGDAQVVAASGLPFGATCVEMSGGGRISVWPPVELESRIFTLQGFVRAKSFTNYSMLYATNYGNGEGGNDKILLFVDAAGTVSFYSNATFIISSSIPIALNTWAHIALVRTPGNVFTLWINGVAAGTAVYNVSFVRRDVTLGANRDNSQSFNGFMLDWSVSGEALYTAPFAVPNTPVADSPGPSLPAPAADPYWANVVLLLQDSMTDQSSYGTVITPHGTCFMEYAYTLFGKRSIKLIGGFLTWVQALPLGTGDWCIEMFVLCEPQGGYKELVSYRASNASGDPNMACFGISPSQELYMYTTGFVTSGPSRYYGRWRHVALVSYAGNVSIYLDGYAVAGPAGNGQPKASINGSLGSNNDGSENHICNYAGVRITVGQARYTGNFDPPENAFPNY